MAPARPSPPRPSSPDPTLPTTPGEEGERQDGSDFFPLLPVWWAGRGREKGSGDEGGGGLPTTPGEEGEKQRGRIPKAPSLPATPGEGKDRDNKDDKDSKDNKVLRFSPSSPGEGGRVGSGEEGRGGEGWAGGRRLGLLLLVLAIGCAGKVGGGEASASLTPIRAGQVTLLVSPADRGRPELARLAADLDRAVSEMAPRVPVAIRSPIVIVVEPDYVEQGRHTGEIGEAVPGP